MTIEAYPSSMGDFYLVGKDTYRVRDRIREAGGHWDHRAKLWFVSREAAVAVGARVMNRVRRGPVCCERKLGIASVDTLATDAEVAAGKMTVTFCPHCDGRIRIVAGIEAKAECLC
jgi:hypothetical protein